MQNVTCIKIRMELVSNNDLSNDIEGIDNVILTPEPTSVALFGLAGLALRASKRRK